MILKIFPDECALCHQSNPNPVHEIRVRGSKPVTIEFDAAGNRYAVYLIDDTNESLVQYQKLVAEGEIKPKR